MAKKIGSLDEDLILVGAIGVGGFFLLKKILPDFGATPEEKQAIQNQAALDPPHNIFTPEYQPYVDWFNVNATWQGYTTSTEFYQGLAKMYYDNNAAISPAMGVMANVVGWAESLYGDLSGFILPNNLTDAIYILNQVQYGWQVGAIAEYLADVYNVNLWDMLSTGAGLTVKGLGSTDLVAAINRLNNLPDQ
jgi:hypothetical protein